ncbi:thiamine-phosphate kinase [Oceanobacillus saliphilus]|uniref:thiamine-phosphate kinase n=1 Tax=Oceanobacillus saliphilus TaxID=2925834 RepID=UPI00201DCFBC|nr:thiamine-phosphate kinase [Oceanobacillus saliphilus]
MDEFSFIDSIKQDSNNQPSLVKGIGDDAAVFRTSNDIITAVDTFVENVHFSRETMEPFHIGYRALAANISDLAAMGALPVFYLVSIVIPKGWEEEELLQIYAGMKSLAEQHKMDLIGGDTVSGSELTVSITAIGYTNRDKARYRSSAKPEDIVFVTGTLGDSQAGFHILTNPGSYRDADYFINRHRMPSPRVTFANKLIDLSRIAFNDISDGIASEANEIAETSHVTIILNEETLPTSDSYDQFPLELQNQWKLYGGEDFELLGTIASEDWEVLKKIAHLTNTKVTRIGYVAETKRDGQVILKSNRKNDIILEKKGYRHLK